MSKWKTYESANDYEPLYGACDGDWHAIGQAKNYSVAFESLHFDAAKQLCEFLNAHNFEVKMPTDKNGVRKWPR